MRTRLLVLAAVALAVVGVAIVLVTRVAPELSDRAWAVRRRELAELALAPPSGRRPWEVRFEALAERVRSSRRFGEIVDSPYRPHCASGRGEPRRLDDRERVWVESLWNELEGLDAVLATLRDVAPEDLAWNGETPRLQLARELTNALCCRAWLALEAGDHAAAAETYADALRLARALDDGRVIGAMVRTASEQIVLVALHAALGSGAEPRVLRAELVPSLERLGFDAARVERAIRLELAGIPAAEAAGAPYDVPAFMLAQYTGVEEWLALAREPARVLEASAAREDRGNLGVDWGSFVRALHHLHVRRNVALTALAVADFRAREGRFPATLAEVPDLPAEHSRDAYGRSSLPYRTDGATAQIGPGALATTEAARALDVWVVR